MAARALRPGGHDLDLEGRLFVLGKGGVGKSVLCEGLAALAAGRGLRTLLVRVGESLHSSAPRVEPPKASRHGFDVVDLEARRAMDEYVQHAIRIRPLVARVTGSEIYRKFFAAAPGLPELVLLGRIRAYSRETDRDQAPRWHTIVVDCPSSGHGLLMLETPFAAARAVSAGPFARLAGKIIDWLKLTKIVVVAIPEEMAVIEAIEFKSDLLERTGLTPTVAFLNRMRDEALSPAAHLALTEVEAAPGSNDALLLECGLRAQRRTRLEKFHQRRLSRGLGLSPILIRELPNCRPSTVAAAIGGERR